ncbi:hypothetical protein [Emticicia sp. TH156]|uniref:DUF7668 domain-containing protein n=1 Tax=Emticicia sp. TH156 TaxID=2067454 RepID=UPI000C7891C0|nr:hypothetical protein [Emticicia sp. TH156]PLK45787.1 hypothetical protein C0V77_00050 [Emticicia sp. TH156]
MKKNNIEKILKKVVEYLTDGNYNLVYENDKNKRLSIAEIETAIKEYNGTISFPPNNAFDNFYDYNDESSNENFIEFNLWFDNSESDLTLSITIYETGEYSIEDIHVL